MAIEKANRRSRTRDRQDDAELIVDSPPASLAAIAEIFRQVLTQEGVARKTDLAGLSTRIDSQEAEQKAQANRIEKMENAISAMALEIKQDRDARREETSVQASSFAAVAKAAAEHVQSAIALPAPPRSQPATEEWCPSTLNVRGFSPFNAGNDTKLSREEFRAEGQRLLGLLPSGLRANLDLSMPFALNHQVSFRIKTKDRDKAFEIVSSLNQNISLKDHRIRNCTLRASAEIHPDRRVLFKNAYSATELLIAKGVPKSRFDLCERSLRVYTMPEYDLAGSTDTTSKAWIWTTAGKLAFGLEADDAMG